MRKIKLFFEIIKYTWTNHRVLCITILLENLFSASMPLIDLGGIGVVTNSLIKNDAFKTVINNIIIYVLLSFIVLFISKSFKYINTILMRKSSNIIQMDYMKNGVYIDYHWAQDGSVLDMKKKSMISNPVFSFISIGNLFNYIIKSIGIIAVFAYFSPSFILIISVISILSVYLTLRSRNIEFDYKNSNVKIERKIEYIYNIMTKYEFAKDVRVNDFKEFLINKYNLEIEEKIKNKKNYTHKQLNNKQIITVLTVLQTIFIYGYFSYMVYVGSINIAEYSVLVGAATLITNIVIGFFDNLATINEVILRKEIYDNYKDWVMERCGIYSSVKKETIKLHENKNEIKFENVSFIYPNTERYVLNNLNFCVKDGEKVGIVGLNGSGKTTIVKLLLRLYEPTKGTIYLNDIDINKIPLNQYLEKIGVILQDYYIFSYSLKENIAFDKDIANEDVLLALKKSGLGKKYEEMINCLDVTMTKELFDNGIELSGGDNQKLALARALIKKSGILIMDEPTSNMDPIAEHEMFSKLDDISKGKTTVFISHRLTSTKCCDKIFVIDDGCIYEEGDHNTLMERKGIYYDMYKSQAKYYSSEEVMI